MTNKRYFFKTARYTAYDVQSFLPGRVKAKSHVHDSLTKKLTGYSLFANLDNYNEGSVSTDHIALDENFSYVIEITQDFDSQNELMAEQFGKIVHSSEVYEGIAIAPDSDHVYVDSDNRGHKHIWLLPEYPISERYETLHRYGMNKHDARLLAIAWANGSGDTARSMINGYTYWYGYNVTLYLNGQEIDSDSCWGFYTDSDGEFSYSEDQIDSWIDHAYKEHKASFAAATKYAYA